MATFMMKMGIKKVAMTMHGGVVGKKKTTKEIALRT